MKQLEHRYSKNRKPYRLALITNQAFSISNFRGSLIRDWIKLGIEVFAIAPDFDAEKKAQAIALGAVPIDCSMSRGGMNPFRDALDCILIFVLLRRLQVNATFACTIKPVIYGSLAARAAGVAERFAMIEGAGYVFTENDKPSFSSRFFRYFVSILYRFGLSAATNVFLLNKDDRVLFVEEGMVDSRKVNLINGIGLDLNYFKQVNLVLNPVTFVFVARLLKEKGIYDYVEAAYIVKKCYPTVRFLLIGSVDLNPGSVTEYEVRSWVDTGVIEWPGQVSDVRPWLSQASVFVLPSYYREGLPRSTQEAMALGLPIITTDSPGCRETVEDGVNGFMIPVRSPESLVRAMLKFIECPKLILLMGEESRRIAEKKFNVVNINAEILNIMGFGS